MIYIKINIISLILWVMFLERDGILKLIVFNKLLIMPRRGGSGGFGSGRSASPAARPAP